MEMYTRSIQAVLGPHFLFNSLDTIVGLAAEERKETLMRSLMALTIQLEGAMRNAANEVTVAQEMEYVASYLEIQGFRFDGRFTIDISVDPQIMYENIPRFCIQPVIENCFTHAIPESPELVQIALLIHPLDDKSIIVIVTDNGPGVSVERRRSLQETLQSRQVDWEAGIGLAAVNARLIESHGNNYGIRIVEPGDDILNKYRDTVKDGFTILMFLPRLGIEHEEG
jgi:two-component system sensor histidine kinase YesM